MAKGIHATNQEIQQMFALGADYVLSVSPPRIIPGTDPARILFEASAETIAYSLTKEPRLKAGKYVCNSRNLLTGETSHNFLKDYLDLGVWVCQASNISTSSDVNRQVNAFLVGQNLEIFALASKPSYNYLPQYEENYNSSS
jgi:hypothetical protein